MWDRALEESEVIALYERGVATLDLNVKSCDDDSCSGESWTDITDTSPQSLSINNNQYFQYKYDLSTSDASYSPDLYNVSVGYTLLSVCGANGCEVGEDYTNCPDDCCDSDCTGAGDSTLHYACDGYNSCSILSDCDSQTTGYLACYNATNTLTCPATLTYCGSGLFCNNGACSDCSSVCDNSCSGTGATCYGTDPDCDVNGTATTACCGNGACEGSAGESCSNCETDCGVCQITLGVCGNGICEEDYNATYTEDCSSCSLDCGGCTGEVCNIATCRGSCGTCKENLCVNNVCVCNYIGGCCGNNICETDESYATCDEDCGPSSITVDLIEPVSGSTYMRGEEIMLVANVTYDEGDRGVGANVTATTPIGEYTLRYYNTDGTYKANITIPNNASTGSWSLDITAVKVITGAASRIVTVSNEYIVTGNTDKATYTKNERILLSGSVTNARGEYVDSDLTININEDILTSQSINGFYNTSHLTNILDPTGTWDLEITASDQYNNSGTKTINIEVNEPEEGTYYNIIISSPAEGVVIRGQIMTITAEVLLGSTAINGASVKFTTPDSSEIDLREISNGKYSSSYTIDKNAPLGEWKLEVIAQKGLTGIGVVNLVIDPALINIEIKNPTKSTASIGETITVEVEARYPDGSYVELPKINITINNETLELERVSKGIYSNNYVVGEGSDSLNMNLEINDEANNTGVISFDMQVSGISIEHYFRNYWFITYPIIIVSIIGALMGTLRFVKKSSIEAFEDKKKKLILLKKDTQENYFNKKTISKGRYDELMAKYNGQLDTVNNQIKKMKSKKRSEK